MTYITMSLASLECSCNNSPNLICLSVFLSKLDSSIPSSNGRARY